MPVFHFRRGEYELFWRYYKGLYAFLDYCGYCLEKWEILNAVCEGVNCETRVLLKHWDFCIGNINKAWDWLQWLAPDAYEFEAGRANSYIPLLPP